MKSTVLWCLNADKHKGLYLMSTIILLAASVTFILQGIEKQTKLALHGIQW